jgi:Tfp pilus assembly protein PilP
MKITIGILILTILLPFIVSANESTTTVSVDTIQILKISGQDERAVIKTPDSKMQIIKVGDPIGDHAKVVEIVTGRVVIEEKKGKESEKIIIRLENGKQQVERLKRTGELHPEAYAATIPQEPLTQKPAAREKQPTKIKEVKKNKTSQKKKSSSEKSGIENIR